MNVYLYAGDQIIENVTTQRFYYQDGLGSTSHLSDAVGNLLERYTYSGFGSPYFYNAAGSMISASSYGTRHLFQGQLWTQQTGLNDYRNRSELPTMGVFMQPDPIGFKGDAANLYRFCTNNAVNRTDPMGLVDTNSFIWRNACFFDSGNSSQGSYPDFMKDRYQAGMDGGGGGKSISAENEGGKQAGNSQTSANPSAPIKLTRKIIRTVQWKDKETGTHWVYKRWQFTLTRSGQPVAGVPISESIYHDPDMKDFKAFEPKWDSHTTDAYGRVYDEWKLGFSSEKGYLKTTQTLFMPDSTTRAVHTVTIGATGWHQFDNPRREEDPLEFK